MEKKSNMASRFGPWATPINTGMNPQLSSFWRQRMTRLAPTSQTSPVLSRRNLLWLGAAGALTAVLPTFRSASALADEDQPAREEKSESNSRIFVFADLKTKPAGSDNEEDFRGIIAVDPETGEWEKVMGDCGGFRMSPDGKTIAYMVGKPANKEGYVEGAEVWTYDRASKKSTKILDDGGCGLCWSPDGKQIITAKTRFTEDDKSDNSAWQMNVDGSSLKKLLVPETDELNHWSRDGKWFVTVANREPPFGSGYQLYRMRPDGSEELRLTKGGLNCSPRFSPDSRKLVYLHQTGKNGNSLHVMDVDGKNDREVVREEGVKSVESGCFSPDGRRLAVLRFDWELDEKGEKFCGNPELQHYRLEIMDIDGTNPRELPLVGAKVVWLGRLEWQ